MGQTIIEKIVSRNINSIAKANDIVTVNVEIGRAHV